MTLIELLVAMVIGLGVTLAVSSMVVVGENHKRTTTSTNDAEQTGAYAFNALDRALRGAGSGIAESAYPNDAGVLGCTLSASANGTTMLPRNAAFPAPFSTLFLGGAPNTLRVAPVLIGQKQSDDGISDVLVVMGGSGAAGGVSRQVTNPGTSTSLVLDNTVAFQIGDLGLVSQSGIPDCLIEEVTQPPAGSTLNLDTFGTYYTAQGPTTTLATLAGATASFFTPLGNAGSAAAPSNVQFLLFGVGGGGMNRTLYSYDLLQSLNLVQSPGSGDTAQAIADGVAEMHAIYGTLQGGVSSWSNPDAASNFDIATVMTNTAKMRQIVAVRVALVLRGNYYDKNAVSPATLTLFSGLMDSTGAPVNAVQRVVPLSANDQHYRYRVFEFTVPLRNMLLLAAVKSP